MQNESTRGRLALNDPSASKIGPKRPKNGPKWSIFKNTYNAYGVGTLNLSQEMSDKMQNESGQFNYIELRKRQKCGQN